MSIKFLISAFLLFPALSLSRTLVEIDTPPIATTVVCNDKVKGVVPLKFELENGFYKCSLSHKLTETINFDLKIDDDKSIKIIKILTTGKMTDAQKKITIQRTP